MSSLRVALLACLLLVAVGLIVAGRWLFRARRNRLQIEAREREAAFLRMNTPRNPPA